MKIILSRKGFDSSAGGVANPILPDGSMVSLPIPDPEAPYRYRQIKHNGHGLGSLVRSLTRGRLNGWEKAHLDPDLREDAVARQPGWKPLFGQAAAAQGHLKGMDIAPGDLFLYFGWFRQTCYANKRLAFQKDASDQHAFFGWLQIGEIVDLNQQEPESWMKQHPHCFGNRGKNNVLYVAADQLDLPGMDCALPGAGTFDAYHPDFRLTAPGYTRRYWKLPKWFHPENRASCLTYHYRPDWWQQEEDHVLLKSAARGQDFVLNCDHYPEAIGWAKSLVETGATDPL